MHVPVGFPVGSPATDGTPLGYNVGGLVSPGSVGRAEYSSVGSPVGATLLILI